MQPVIGLEIHCELLTDTKVFCSCKNEFAPAGDENKNVCPVCLGLPGALPVLNRRALELAVRAGLALGCEIAEKTRWDRKNYFYPDSPKAYQISQLYAPFCAGGGLEINGRFIRIHHIHLEEDAGKLIHDNLRGVTRMDFNRCGVPLIEIVTEPDITSAEEAAAFAEQVRLALVYAGVSDGKMEQGSLRADANVSVMPIGSAVLGTRTETKNLNSFRHITMAINYEISRQTELIGGGGKVTQETLRFSEATGETSPLRSKEDAHDYRYFPDPDLPPIAIDPEYVANLRKNLGEMPLSRKKRYLSYGLTDEDCNVLLADKKISDFFDGVDADKKTVCNLLRGEILRRGEIRITPEDLAELVKNADKLDLKKAANAVMDGAKPRDLIITEDTHAVSAAVKSALSENEKAVAQYKNGDAKVFGFLMGQCSKALKGKALPQTIKTELEKQLNA